MRRRDFSKKTLMLGLAAGTASARPRPAPAAEDTYEEPSHASEVHHCP